MKKLVALLLSSAMLATTIAGLAACKPDHDHVDEDGNGYCDVCEKKLGEHTKHPDNDHDGKCDFGGEAIGPVSPEGFKRAEDPRDQSAYEVYGPDGELVAAFPSLATAINAAVENDLDFFEQEGVADETPGSYVVKKGTGSKMFVNYNTIGAAGDIYWYYQDNALVGCEPWETGLPYSRTSDNTIITMQSASGTATSVATSGYKIYDGMGQLIPKDKFDLSSRSWEIVDNVDASIKGIPVREKLATGARYTLDLSEVKVTPAYEGVEDSIYAFFGFTVAAGNYSVEVGLACNTLSGEWKQYIGHNPNNNLRNVVMEYDIGETIIASTWHEDGGYFTPDLDSVDLEIMEEADEDENGDTFYFDHLTITAGEKKLDIRIDSDYITEHGSAGVDFDMKNGFFFSAGLDIVAAGAQLGDPAILADYTNGAKFENLIVESAEIYFPTEDEIDPSAYGALPQADVEPGWHDINERTFNGDVKSGIYNYTIIQVAAHVKFEQGGEDRGKYSFDYSGSAVNNDTRAGELKTYQDMIDSLKAITSENAGDYKDTLDQVEKWYGKTGKVEDGGIAARFWRVVDWKPYLDAKEVYKNAVTVTEAGEKVITAFNALGLHNVVILDDWQGWRSESGATKGYLYDEMQMFKPVYEQFKVLGESDQNGIRNRIAEWMYWEELYVDYTAALASEFASKSFSIATFDMEGEEVKTGAELLDEFFVLVLRAWKNNSDDHEQHGGALCVELNHYPRDTEHTSTLEDRQRIDTHYMTTFRLLFIDWLLKQEDVTLGYSYEAIEILAATYPAIGFPDDFDYIANVMHQIERILSGECEYLDEELAEVVNTYMVGYDFKNGTFRWAWYHANGDLNDFYAIRRWKRYFGEFGTDRKFRELVTTVLLPILQEADPTVSMPTLKPWGDVADGTTTPGVNHAVKALNPELSEKGKAWLASYKQANLSDLSTVSPDVWHGWASGSGSEKGYLKDELDQFNKLLPDYLTLEKMDLICLKADGSVDFENWARWMAFSEDYKNATTSAFGTKTVTVKGDTFTGAQLIDEFFKTLYLLDLPAYDNNGGTPVPNGQKIRNFAASGEGFANSWRLAFIHQILTENMVEIGLIDEIVELMSWKDDANQYDGAGFLKDFAYFYHVFTQLVRVEELEEIDYELAKAVNDYMVGFEAFHEPNWAWAYNNNGSVFGIDTISQPYFGVVWDTNFVTTVKPLFDFVTAHSETEVNESGLGFTSEVDLPEQEAFTAQEVVAKFATLGDLNDLAAWDGFSGSGDRYLENAIKSFSKLLAAYKSFEANDQGIVDGAVDQAKWAQYKTLAEQVAALNSVDQTIDVKVIGNNGASANTVKVTELNVFGGYINCVFFQNKTPCTDFNSNGYLCCNSMACFLNSVRCFYLHELAHELGLKVDYFDTTFELLKDSGSGSNDNTDTSMPNGERTILDFEYLWNVGKQIVRIMKGECTYLDEDLAKVVNDYMVADEGNGSQYGIHESFHNGTFSWFYRTVWSAEGPRQGTPVGDLTDGGTNWKFYIDDAFMDETLNPKNQYGFYKSWSELLGEYLNPILVRDAGGQSILKDVRSGSAQGLVNPMLIAHEVEALEKDPTAELAGDVLAVYTEFMALGLPAFDDVTALKGGATEAGNTPGYIYDAVKSFRTVYAKIDALDAGDRATVVTKIGREVLNVWTALDAAYQALEADENEYDIIGSDLSATAIKVSALDLVNEFFDCALRNYDGDASASGSKYGYFCTEHGNHALNTMRALYLHKMIEVNEIDFKLADDVLDMIIHLEADGVSKYTGFSESEGAYKDFEYLWNVGKQIVRIMQGLDHIDAELASVVNNYMVATETPDSINKGRPYGFGIRETFSSLGFADAYRNHAWDEKGDPFVCDGQKDTWDTTKYAWKNYIDPALETEDHKSWGTLMITYLNPVLEASDPNIMVSPADGNFGAPMCVKHTVTAAEAAQAAAKSVPALLPRKEF